MQTEPKQIQVKIYQPYLQDSLQMVIESVATPLNLFQRLKKQLWIEESIFLFFQQNLWIEGPISQFLHSHHSHHSNKEHGKSDGSIQLQLSYKKKKDFKFNAMDPEDVKKKKVKAVTNARSVRKVRPGAVLHTYCRNQKCQAFGKEVLVNLGFGKFNISKQALSCKCPLCFQQPKFATNIGFYRCEAFVQGDKSNQSHFQERYVANDQLYLTFKKDGTQNIRSWIYIEATVTHL